MTCQGRLSLSLWVIGVERGDGIVAFGVRGGGAWGGELSGRGGDCGAPDNPLHNHIGKAVGI